ncbi:MAG: family 43 glycosylhydrolase [Bacteroidota bacterium]|nr:family 43 glycosylhydrolase [Bacteroidota bacterium]
MSTNRYFIFNLPQSYQVFSKAILKQNILFYLIISLWFSGCASPRSTPERNKESVALNNPVLPGDRPDPTAIKIGDTYYASTTSNSWLPLFPIYKSKDLENWELVTYVFPDSPPEWSVINFWAPELAYDEKQKKVYVYYTARDKNTDRLSVAVASANNPEGPYKDHGPLVAQEMGSIDAYEIRDEKGKLYLLWKEDGNSKGQPTPIWAQEINEDRTHLIGEMHELFRNDEPWERNLVEGVAVFRKGNYFYATYSAGSCCDLKCNYKTGVARSEKLLGPWGKYDKNPILTDNEDWRCPGHGTVVEKDDDFYLLYHAYNTKGSVYVGRQGVLEKMLWTDDGWPYFKNAASYNREASNNFRDDFADGLDPAWQWHVTQDIQYKTGKNGLLLGASKENNDIGSLLVQHTKSTDYTIVATIDLRSTGENSEGGVALIGAANQGFGAPVASIGISAGNGKIKVWETKDGVTKFFGEAAIESGTGLLDLKMEVKDGHKLSFFYKNSDGWVPLMENKDANNLLVWGMGFRYGLVAKGDPSQLVNFKQVNIVNN